MRKGPGYHVVKKMRPGKAVRWYIYAWRGGPQVHYQEGGGRPRITPEIIDAIAEARENMKAAPKQLLEAVIQEYRSSPEWNNLSITTRKNGWNRWLDKIQEKFGEVPIDAFADYRMGRDIMEWRDTFASSPRTADMCIQVFSALLGWAVSRRILAVNIARGIGRLYNVDRSEIIWADDDFKRLEPHANECLWRAIRVAELTGLRRGDLVKLPWSAVGQHAIIWRTSKTRSGINIPMLPELRKILDETPRMSGVDTILTNSLGRPWTPSGLEAAFKRAKKKAGITVRLHDLRGTFATRCVIEEMTDEQISKILGWSKENVERIREKYVASSRVVVAIGERIANKRNAATVNQL